MTARTPKASKRKAKPAKANGTIPQKPEANATSLATTDKPNGHRKTPVPYTDEIGDIICNRLRDGETLNAICKTEGMPTESTVRLWASEDTPFSAKYARARELGYQKMADDLVDIADNDPDPVKARLRVDTRKWVLAKALPKIYGDRLEVDAKAGLVVVETPAAIRALLDALPDLGVLPGIASVSSSGEVAVGPIIDGERS